jgi:MFS family permease
VLVAAIPGTLLQSERAIGRGHWRDLREGFDVVLGTRALLAVLVAWTIAMVASGGINVAEVFLAKSTFDAGDFGFGLLWAGTGVGMIAGGLLASRLIERDGIGRTYSTMLLVFALGIAGAAAAPNVWVAVGAMVVSGFGNGAAVVSNITLVQRGAPDRVRGRAFTTIMSVNYAMLLVAFVAAGPLTNAFGARWVYAVAAIALVAAAAAARIVLRGGTVAEA